MPKDKIKIGVNEVRFSWLAKRVLTTPRFWDCSCDQNNIHPQCERYCDVCDDERDNSPDARIEEVIEMLLREACEEHDCIEVKTKTKTKTKKSNKEHPWTFALNNINTR